MLTRFGPLDLLETIAVKEETGGAKDIAALPILRSTLEEQRRQSRGARKTS